MRGYFVKSGPRRRHLIPVFLQVVLAMLVFAWLPQAAFAEGQAGQQSGSATEAATAVAPQANLPDLEDEVMCPICGTLLGLSRAPAAERQRVFMRKLIAEGKNGQQIKDALVAEYGPQVLALPDDDSINFFVYLVPLAGLILAALGVLWAAIRWRRNRYPGPPTRSQGGPLVPSSSDSDRLDHDLADFDR